MGRTASRSLRLGIWWTVLIGSISTLVALNTTGYPSKKTVLFFVGWAGFGLLLLAIEYGWFRTSMPIGRIPRALFILLIIGGLIFGVGYWAWPPDMFLYVKPAVEFNPGTPNAMWMFFAVIRGPEPMYQVGIRMDDLLKEEEHEKRMQAAKSDEERLRIGPLVPDYFGPYPELDPSPNGMDMEVAKFLMATGTNNRLRYKIYINHRKGMVTEDLEINTAPDRHDWQYRMQVWDNDDLVVNCRDPRFLDAGDRAVSDLPQCFPEFQGKLYQSHHK